MIDHKSLLVCIEGIDGAGKTTQTKLVGDKLKSQGYNVLTTFEPGDTLMGAEIKSILRNYQSISKLTEALLMLADRNQHTIEIIKPELLKGTIVITDRYYISTFTYQLMQNNLDQEIIDAMINIINLITIPANLSFYLKIDIKTAIERLNNRKSNKEGLLQFENKDVLERVSLAYDRIFDQNISDEENRDYFMIIDANKEVNQVTDLIVNKIINQLK